MMKLEIEKKNSILAEGVDNENKRSVSNVVDLGASQKHVYGSDFVLGTNEKAVGNFNHGSHIANKGNR